MTDQVFCTKIKPGHKIGDFGRVGSRVTNPDYVPSLTRLPRIWHLYGM